MLYCNFVKIGIAIKPTKKTKTFIQFFLFMFHISLSLSPHVSSISFSTFICLQFYSFTTISHQIAEQSFIAIDYKIKANTITSSNAKRQRYKTDVWLIMFMNISVGWLDGGLVDLIDCWLPTNALTHIMTFMENIKTCKINIASWLKFFFSFIFHSKQQGHLL